MIYYCFGTNESFIQASDELFARGSRGHLQHLDFRVRHLPADPPVEAGQGDVLNLIPFLDREAFAFSRGFVHLDQTKQIIKTNH